MEPLLPQAGWALAALLLVLVTGCALLLLQERRRLRRLCLLLAEQQRRETRLHAIIDTAVDSIITIDRHGHIQSANQATSRLFGWSAQELHGRNVNTLMPEPQHSAHDGYLRHYLSGGTPQVIGTGRDVVGLSKDGRQLPLRLAVCRADLDGETLFVGFLGDIAPRKNMEMALRERETQYRTLIANIPGAVFRCSADDSRRAQFVSDAIQTLSGWPATRFLQQAYTLQQLIHPDDRAYVQHTVRLALAARQAYTLEYRLLRQDGSCCWVREHASASYGSDGQPQWLDGVLLDVTTLRQRDADYQAIVAALDQALTVVEFALDGTILRANHNYLQLLGYRAEELIGQSYRLLCPPEDDNEGRPAGQRHWQRLQAGETISGEFCRRHRDGHLVWLHAHYHPLAGPDGKPCRIIQFATDLSQRMAMEQALRDARDRSEQAAQAKSAFLANMSHEIRTPMNAVLGFSKLLHDTTLDQTQRHYLDTVEQAAQSLLTLLDDILDTAKLERGAVGLDCADFSLRDLCQQLLAQLQLAADSKGIDLSLDYPATVGDYYHGDAHRLRQILLNLLDNAIKFTTHGGVRLQVGRDGELLRLTVVDSGIGIAPERLAHIFDPFTQADASTSRRFGGSGLGTTIARQLAELMDGHISASSSPGIGSSFCVQLPLPAATAANPDVVHGYRPLPPLRILIADDVPQNLELLELLLRRDGHQVETARDGQDAVQRHADSHFDLILMDIHMPQLDGLAATRQIRAHEQAQQRPAVAIIALSASVLSDDQACARDAGMDGFAGKPVRLPQLYAEVARVLRLPPPSPLSETATTPRHQVLDLARGLLLWGEHERLLHAVGRFLHEYRELVAHLPALLDSEGRPAVVALLHRMRGAAGNLALEQLHQLVSRLEEALGNAPEQVTPLLAALPRALDDVAATLEVELARLSRHDMPLRPASRQQQLAWLDELAAMLPHGALAPDALLGLRQSLRQPLLDTLCRHIDDFDFDQALALLPQLRQQLSGAPPLLQPTATPTQGQP